VDRTRAKMRFGSVNMHLTKKKKRRELVYLIEHWIKADICGIAETWIKDGGEELTAELKDSELAWFGRDRKERRGGGVGFLVRKDLQVKVAKQNKSEGLFWVEVQGRLFVAVVYLIPNDRSGLTEDTLQELQEDIISYRERGEVVVMGDFNCRIGEQSNCIMRGDSEVLEIARRSEDQVDTVQGRNLLEN